MFIRPSPLSWFHLINDVVDVGAFENFLVGPSLFPTYSEDSSEFLQTLLVSSQSY